MVSQDNSTRRSSTVGHRRGYRAASEYKQSELELLTMRSAQRFEIHSAVGLQDQVAGKAYRKQTAMGQWELYAVYTEQFINS